MIRKRPHEASHQVVQQLEEFRLALLRQTEKDLWGHLIAWSENEEDTDRLKRISTMLKITISEQRKVQYDHRLRERIAGLSLDNLTYWQTSVYWQRACKPGVREKARHLLKRCLKVFS